MDTDFLTLTPSPRTAVATRYAVVFAGMFWCGGSWWSSDAGSALTFDSATEAVMAAFEGVPNVGWEFGVL